MKNSRRAVVAVLVLGVASAAWALRYKSLREINEAYPVPSDFVVQLRSIRDKDTLIKLETILLARLGGLEDLDFQYRYKRMPFTDLDKVAVEHAIEVTKKNMKAVDERYEALGFPRSAPVQAWGHMKSEPSSRPAATRRPQPRSTPRPAVRARPGPPAPPPLPAWVSTFNTGDLPSTEAARRTFLGKAFSVAGQEATADWFESKGSPYERSKAHYLRARAKLLRQAKVRPGLPPGTGVPAWAAPLLEAARYGDPEAQAALGWWGPKSYYGFEMPLEEAIAWCEAAAAAGHGTAPMTAEKWRKQLAKQAPKARPAAARASSRPAAPRRPRSTGTQVTWEETPTHRIKIKTVDGQVVGRWEFRKK